MATHPGRVPVRLVSDLCAAALKQKQDKELALWYCLRQLNVTGCGRISLEDATDGLIKIFGYSRRTVFRHLVLGEGRYWERFSSMRGHQIRIYALETVAQHLGSISDKHWREIAPRTFTSLSKRRSALYAAIHKPKGVKANPISRIAIETRTGCCSKRQRRYEKIAKVKMTLHYGVIQVESVDGKEKYKPATMTVASKSREHTIQRRLPNSYHSQTEPGHTGVLRKVSKALNGGSSNRGIVPQFFHIFFICGKYIAESYSKGSPFDYANYTLMSDCLQEGTLLENILKQQSDALLP